ncbi:MAG: TlpA family protein disulfide reductase [Anaerolineae bacterium]
MTPAQARAVSRRRLVAQIIVLGSVLGLLLFLAYGLRLRGSGPVQRGEAPPFTLSLFDGGQLSLQELRGQVVVINFWASWCGPCEDEAPLLERVWRDYKDRGVVFVGIDYVDTEPAARAYLKRFNITYPNGPDLGSKISHAYRIRGVPETFFVDKEGQLADFHIGPISEERLIGVIERLLK